MRPREYPRDRRRQSVVVELLAWRPCRRDDALAPAVATIGSRWLAFLAVDFDADSIPLLSVVGPRTTSLSAYNCVVDDLGAAPEDKNRKCDKAADDHEHDR